MAGLAPFAFDSLHCTHVEFMDRNLPTTLPRYLGYVADALRGFEVQLGDDEAMMGAMTANGRRDVRRGIRNGIEVELVDPLADRSFAHEYYSQALEAFAKRGLAPPYPPDRVEAMLRHLAPHDQVVALRAYDPHGRPAATGIFPGLPDRTAVFWMGASRRTSQRHLPNEPLMWHAFRAWRDRGAARVDLGGHGHYKAKYGGRPIAVPWFRRSRIATFEVGRSVARQAHRFRQERSHRLDALPAGGPPVRR